jgi:GrpB-like predicted nucleotidyltransferase (UPF0157 family)/GNAT superfamily N-acetyltransferase
MFNAEKAVIVAALGDNCLEIYHIGSTSVPGLAAKPKIDMIAVAKDRQGAIASLETVGYAHKGEWNIPLKCGFTKRDQPVEANLHVFFDKNHPEIELNLRFRDYLRINPDVRDAYAATKREILKDETSQQKVGKTQLPVYSLRKSGFIKGVINAFGFDRLRVLKCFTDDEWDAAKALRQRTFFDKRGIQDPYYWTFDHPEHEHFILYRGVKIVGYAHIQLCLAEAILRAIVITEEYRDKGLGSQFLAILEEWLIVHDYEVLHVETSPIAINFYKKHGYVEMTVDDPYLDPHDTQLSKVLK